MTSESKLTTRMKNLVPGKTFLVGEYSVLREGAAIGLATSPGFEIVPLQTHNQNQQLPFHPESPAGRYLRATGERIRYQLNDPYLAAGIQGGLGRSTAEFFAVLSEADRAKPFSEIRKLYLDLHAGESQPPSGADLAFQYYGQVCVASLESKNFQSHAWPFKNLHFFIVATGRKVATHQHLAELKPDQLNHLPRQSDLVIRAFVNKVEIEFLDTLRNWVEVLNAAGLTHENSNELRKQLETNSDILLVKPCGALGADVVLVFCESAKQYKVRDALLVARLQIVAGVKDLCRGVGQDVG
ncbi:MAG: hypothetical protein H7061_04570 [Bdellovibrionaceae bacterium]|nr:hypothetical protein [Bdellovibrio sp.]